MKAKLLKIAIIGSGKVALYLSRSFLNKGLDISVYARSLAPGTFDPSIQKDTLKEAIKDASIVIIAVKDDAIKEVSASLKNSKAIVCHCSGALTTDQIVQANKAIFYPLLSISENEKTPIEEIPFILNSNNEESLKLLIGLTYDLGSKHYVLDEDQKTKLHLAAVFAQNFSNHLIAIAEGILENENIDRAILHPLLSQSIKRLENKEAKDLQTGPAVRDDQMVLQKHLNLLDSKELKDIYSLITKHIEQSHGNKL